jgi:hypothetical protein
VLDARAALLAETFAGLVGVQGTDGAELAPGLDLLRAELIIRKGFPRKSTAILLSPRRLLGAPADRPGQVRAYQIGAAECCRVRAVVRLTRRLRPGQHCGNADTVASPGSCNKSVGPAGPTEGKRGGKVMALRRLARTRIFDGTAFYFLAYVNVAIVGNCRFETGS